MKVLFLSVAYMPKRLTSDKQFLRDIIFRLPADVTCAVWTINDWPKMCVVEEREGRSVPVYGQARLLHSPSFDRQSVLSGDYTYKFHKPHSGARQHLEILATFYARLGQLKRVIKRENPDIIHLTDNWGAIGLALRAIAGHRPITLTKYSVAVPTSRKRRYGAFMRACMLGLDKVLCFTDACREQLGALGISPDRLATVRWGINVPAPSSCDPSTIAAVRQRYGCTDGELLVVVASQANRGRDGVTRAVAGTVGELSAAAGDVPMRIVVACKPDHWLPEYDSLRSDRVVVERGPSDFLDLLWAADVMFSPTFGRFKNRTTTPPLTWLEAMARNTPVITTPGCGVGETIVDGENGIIYDAQGELKDKIDQLTDPDYLQKMAHAARETIIQQHSVAALASQYVGVWTDLLARDACR